MARKVSSGSVKKGRNQDPLTQEAAQIIRDGIPSSRMLHVRIGNVNQLVAGGIEDAIASVRALLLQRQRPNA